MPYLELIIGPMFSGKTTSLITIHNTHGPENVVAINYEKDKRYSKTMLSSHDQVMIPCFNTLTLADLATNQEFLEKYRRVNTVLINEGQFFGDLKDFVLKCLETDGKSVYVCGLDSDFKREKFGQLLDLIPFADRVTKLKANCSACHSPNSALFSHRVTEETSQVVIGVDMYIPLCRECYLRETRKNSRKNISKHN
jgi:thymidine kinase